MIAIDLVASIALRHVVQAGSSAVYTYRIPHRLHDLIAAGALVWVPLRTQTVQGIVLRIEEHLPDNVPVRLRDVIGVADPEARIPAAGLALAPWIATTYQVPLYQALNLLLPPGVQQEATHLWQATPAGMRATLGALPERERAVLYYLRSQGEQSTRDLHHVLHSSEKSLRDACELLQERGLITQGTALSAPRIRPRIERWARLLITPDELDRTLEDLSRAPKQQAVVRWLAEQAPESAAAVGAVYAATDTVLATLQALERKGVLTIEEREVRRDPLFDTNIPPDNPPALTPAQRRVWEPIQAALEGREEVPPVFLLHGVTGSGKTEIYLRAAARAMRLGRQVLVLVPEIALTAQLVRRFAARFPGKIAVLHSRLADGERYDEWRRLRRGDALLAIGSRSAVFAPLPHLGLIIVDEEHEPTYKHDSVPRYHARAVALRLAELTGSVVILGSATPGIESYHAARSGRYRLLEILERVSVARGADGLTYTQPLPLPPVRLVDMRHELQQGNTALFSRQLQAALHQTLAAGQQVILFLNRRGVASFVMCRDCGAVPKCPRCSSTFTVHNEAQEHGEHAAVMICHGCNYRELVPAFCPQCLSPRVKTFGVGTQRVEAEVQHLFPGARTLRWDSDSATGKDAHSRMLDLFLNHEADVLIGTQMIAKGLDLPRIALVGVVAADTALYLPDFRSGERTFQLMTQVAGRAGRRSDGAQVIIQTYAPEHYALRAAQEHDYRSFYLEEIAFRRSMHYPPFARMVRFVYASSSTAACERETTALALRLRETVERLNLSPWGIIGPAPAYIQRMRGRWRWHVLLRVPDPLPVLEALGRLPGWLVDVDPVHLL
ncbi:MAG: primosomal protein N' [Chloroflexaceae bacterium]|nr:primosomal protein N' [Chloroflexaceae bacterium]